VRFERSYGIQLFPFEGVGGMAINVYGQRPVSFARVIDSVPAVILGDAFSRLRGIFGR
jgi:hypothetical protein